MASIWTALKKLRRHDTDVPSFKKKPDPIHPRLREDSLVLFGSGSLTLFLSVDFRQTLVTALVAALGRTG